MNIDKIIDFLLGWLPFSLNLVVGILVIYLAQMFVRHRTQNTFSGRKFYYQFSIFVLINLLVIALIISSPLTEEMKSQLLSLLGITFTAAVALSSTTFLGNIMAGLMLKVLNKFKPGDFLHIESNFGRVTELGLLHTEIQTRDRDLLTLPNIYLVSNPVKVVRTTGTIISEDISLGYDVHHNRVELALLEAASCCELTQAFMHVQSLGDFSVTYRISGFLKDIKSIISAKARLREEILDSLHEYGIEIVSPNFINQRIFEHSTTFIPDYQEELNENPKKAENIIFDKANQAESIENLKARIDRYQAEIKNTSANSNLTKEEKDERIKTLNGKIDIVKTFIKAKNP